jgi:hypothetical protein
LSSSLRPRIDGGGLLDAISSFSRDQRFVVEDREEEEEVKEMIRSWKKQGKAGDGRGVILTRRGTIRRLCPHPLLHCCQYVPLDCASGSVSGVKPSKTTCRLSITREGEGAGAMMLGPLVNGSSQTAAPFQFPFIVLLHG